MTREGTMEEITEATVVLDYNPRCQINTLQSVRIYTNI